MKFTRFFAFLLSVTAWAQVPALFKNTVPPAVFIGDTSPGRCSPGDFFVRSTGVYVCESDGVTTTSVTQAGGQASGTNWTSGTAAPSDGTGSDGDFYLRTTTGAVYTKVSGTWGSPIGGLSVFTGSTAVISTFSATPTFSLADVSVKSPVRFELGAMTANITSVTFTNKTAGAKFSVVYLQDATGGRTKSSDPASNTCTISATASKYTEQFYEVAADGTTVYGTGCVSNDPLDAPMTGPASSTAHDVMSFSDTTGKASEDTGFLASNVVRKDAANTFGAAGTLDLSSSTAAAALRMPNKAGAAPTTAGAFEYDTTNKNVHVGANSVDNVAALFPAASLPTDGNCIKASVTSSVVRLADAGAACGSGGGVTTINGAGSTTQSASEAVIATISMPAMGTNNACHISADFTKAGTASTWGLAARLTNTSGAIFATAPSSIANTSIAANLEMDIKNTGSASQLISGYWTTSTTSGGSFALYVIDAGNTGRSILPQTVNLASPWTLVLTALSGSAMTDTIKSETYNVRCQ